MKAGYITHPNHQVEFDQISASLIRLLHSFRSMLLRIEI